MNKAFYVGSYKDDGLSSPNRGWIVGNFKDFPIEPPRNCSEVEIKYWEYKIGPTNHQMKESSIIECTFILKGKTKAVINGEGVVLSAGEYVVIEPGTPNNTVAEILEDVVGLTVKAPSDPNAKKIVE